MQPVQPTFLQPDEVPLGLERRHPLSALDSWIGIAFMVLLVCGTAFGVAAFVTAEAVPYSLAIAIVAVLLGGASALGVWFRVNTSLNVVTAERVYHAHGKLRFFLSQTTYDRVTDLHVHQSFFGRRFGFGTVLVQTAGNGVALVGVRDPLGTKRLIEEAREAMIRRLVAAHKRTAPKASSTRSKAEKGASPMSLPARARHGGPPAWTGKPTLAALMAQVLPLGLFIVPLLFVSFLGAPASGGFSFLFPAVALVVASILVANAIIRVRTTSYEVHGWGVVVRSGWLSRRQVEARYEKVTDVSVTQNVLGRVFGFGTIAINTAGSAGAPINFVGVRSPDDVKAIVDRARQGTA